MAGPCRNNWLASWLAAAAYYDVTSLAERLLMRVSGVKGSSMRLPLLYAYTLACLQTHTHQHCTVWVCGTGPVW